MNLRTTLAVMAAERSWGFRTRAIHAGARPEPVTGARAVPVFQTTSFVFEDTADAADLFALQKYGNIYTPDQQPDRRRVRGADGEPRGRHRRGGDGVAGSRRSSSRIAAAVRGRRSHRVVRPALRRDADAVRGHARPVRHRRRRSSAAATPAAYAAAITPRTKVVYAEVVANPSGAVADLEGLAAVAHEAGIPLVVDSHRRDAVPVPADRVGRGHRRPLGDEVPRRARHVARRRRRRVGPLRLGQRELPADDRAASRRTAG